MIKKFSILLLDSKKKRFLLTAFFVWGITQITLHIFILYLPIILATSFSQIIYVVLGFHLYRTKVFKIKKINKYNIQRFLLMSLILWLINFYGINFLNIFITNKNLCAILMIPILAISSFSIQKNFIFK